MNKLFLSLALFLIPTTNVANELYILDSIKIKIFTSEGESIVTATDLFKPSLAGQPRTPESMIFEQLVYNDAKKHKINPSDEAIEKRFAMIRKENNLTMEQFQGLFTQAGYTMAEGYEQFKIMDAINTMLDFEIRSNMLFIPPNKIQEYYDQNPIMTTQRYELQTAYIPYTADINTQRTTLESHLNNGNYNFFSWSEPFWIEISELAQDKSFIFDMTPNEVYGPVEGATGFEFYRLTNKENPRLRTLDERRVEIMDILRRPRYEELLEEYKKRLLDEALVVYF
jgi:parvulin-like peptidyl-prolyl isomerase